MGIWGWIWLILLALGGLHLLLSVLPHLWPVRRRPCDPRQGVVIFVEPIRWMGVAWGRAGYLRSLNRSGFPGRSVYWSWHTLGQAMLLVPALRSRRVHRAAALRLARFVRRVHRRRPDRPIWLVGFSGGGWIAVRALELLGPGAPVRGAAICAAPISRRYDLTRAARAVGDRLVVTSSWGDWILLAVGTTLLGTADGRHEPAIGMTGPKPGTPGGVSWGLGDLWRGHLGGHFSACNARWLAERVWPRIGLVGREHPRRSPGA
jgi:hypothetical protein